MDGNAAAVVEGWERNWTFVGCGNGGAASLGAGAGAGDAAGGAAFGSTLAIGAFSLILGFGAGADGVGREYACSGGRSDMSLRKIGRRD